MRPPISMGHYDDRLDRIGAVLLTSEFIARPAKPLRESNQTYRIQKGGAKSSPTTSSLRPTGAIKKRPRSCWSSSLRMLTPQGAAKHKQQSAKLRLAFRSVDPFRALWEPDRRRRGRRTAFPARNKGPATNQNNPMTGRAHTTSNGFSPLVSLETIGPCRSIRWSAGP